MNNVTTEKIMSKDNETVETDALEDILKSLVEAKEATTLAKGGVENSGTHGSGGKQGGGQGSESDAGPIDNMMIAKMIQSGVDVQTAAAFQRFMHGKMSVEIEEEDDEENGMGKSGRRMREAAETLAKSFRETLGEHLSPSDNEMVDVTPYLDGLTSAVGETVDEMHKSLVKSQHRQDTVNRAMSGALAQMGQLLKSQATVINALGERLGLIEKAPAAPPRGVTGTAQPVQKSMAGEAGAGGEVQLTKASTLSALSYMNLVKGVSEIGGRSTSDIITGLEAGNVFDERSHAAVQDFVKSLSADERKRALTF